MPVRDDLLSKELLTLYEVADVLGISYETAAKRVRKGEIVSIKLGSPFLKKREYRVRADVVRHILEEMVESR